MKQKRCYEENICGHCHKVMEGDRRGVWKYYCNAKCMDAAMENFREGLRQLCKGKQGGVVRMGVEK
jgi:hypothetical protein